MIGFNLLSFFFPKHNSFKNNFDKTSINHLDIHKIHWPVRKSREFNLAYDSTILTKIGSQAYIEHEHS